MLNGTPQFDGVSVTTGGTTLVLPALTLGAMKKLRNAFVTIGSIDPVKQGANLTDEQVDAMISIVLASAHRNYPTMTREEVEEFVDLDNLAVIIPAILGQSGMKKAEPGEVVSP
jgi:hypothetical protein